MTVRVAHISDLHVLEWTGTSPLRFLNKRVTGLANLFGARKDAHPTWLLERLCEEIERQQVDHVIISGDLSNLALESEFEAARAILSKLGGGAQLSVVPGNHDVYTDGAFESGRFERYFGAWMVPLDEPKAAEKAASAGRGHYPYRKVLPSGLHIYGLSSAIPAPPLCAWGEVGEAQLTRLSELIASEETEPLARVVVVHHNVHPRSGFVEATARMRDRDALLSTLSATGCDVLLHGHTHTPQQHRLRRQDEGELIVLGCGSSTWFKPHRGHIAHFNIMEFSETGLSHAEAYRWDVDAERFVPASTDLLSGARAIGAR